MILPLPKIDEIIVFFFLRKSFDYVINDYSKLKKMKRAQNVKMITSQIDKKTLLQSINSPQNILHNENVNKASYGL